MENQHEVYWESTLSAWVVKNGILSTYGEEVVFQPKRYSGKHLFVRTSEAQRPEGVTKYTVFERPHLYENENERRVYRLVRFEMDGSITFE